MRRISAICLLLATTSVAAGDDGEFVVHSRPVELAPRDIGAGWREWQGLVSSTDERVTALHVTLADTPLRLRGVWVGTSHGRLHRRTDDNWTIEVDGLGVEITGIAFQQRAAPPAGGVIESVWLSTSDGTRHFDWTIHGVTASRTYFVHRPMFSAFSVEVDSDLERHLGYVDDIFVRLKGYSQPVAISGEHGVLIYIENWHTDPSRSDPSNERINWFDPDAAIPHRRATCIVLDTGGDSWIGTDGDGVVRINGDLGRAWSAERNPGFERFDADDIGCPFTRVMDAELGVDGTLWFALTDYGRRNFVARYRNEEWSVFEIPSLPLAVAEIESGRLLVGVEHTGMLQIDWAKQRVEHVPEFENAVREIDVSHDGTVWATTSNGVYERAIQHE